MDLRELDSEGDVYSAVESPDFQDCSTLHDALQESLDSMTGACSRLRGDDMISVIEDGEMTVLAFAPPRRFEEQEIARSLKRSENLAADILAMDDKVPYSGDSTNRVQTLERQLLEKDLELVALRRDLHEARQAAASAKAKLCRAQSTLRIRDEMLKAKNEDISELHMELHAAARQVASFSRNRRPERPEDENLKELSFLRRQCKLLEEMNQELRQDQEPHPVTSGSGSRGSSPQYTQDIPSEPVASKAPEKDKEANSGPLPSISRAAVRAMA